MSEVSGSTLQDLYEARVNSGSIEADPAQLALLPRLESVRQAVLAHRYRSRLLRVITSWRKPAKPQGLYLWGDVGRGKSMLMDLMITALPRQRTRRVHFHAFLLELHAAVHSAQSVGSSAPIDDAVSKTAAGLEVLALDELDVSDIADAMILDRVFRRLFEQGTFILTTSNRPPSALYRSGLKRELFLPFIALIEDRLDVVPLDAPRDWRCTGREGQQIFFYPLNTETGANFDDFWRRLGGDCAGPTRIPVLGRDLELPEYRNGLARVGFTRICEEPLGPPDFDALAKIVRVLFLDKVPRLGELRLNEARRFVMLVDTIYEARGLIIVRADAPPCALFHPALASEGTSRLQSRLAEMGSARWLENLDII